MNVYLDSHEKCAREAILNILASYVHIGNARNHEK